MADSSESPFYQPEDTGVPAENEAEQAARADYNEERSETREDPIPESAPDWAKDLPDPSESKGGSSGGFCFLTTACIEAAGLSDTCRELKVLRHFRDNYLAHQPNGLAMIDEYYATAPRLVARIHNSLRRTFLLEAIFRDVRRAVSLIESGERKTALEIYVVMFRTLQAEFPE